MRLFYLASKPPPWPFPFPPWYLPYSQETVWPSEPGSLGWWKLLFLCFIFPIWISDYNSVSHTEILSGLTVIIIPTFQLFLTKKSQQFHMDQPNTFEVLLYCLTQSHFWYVLIINFFSWSYFPPDLLKFSMKLPKTLPTQFPLKQTEIFSSCPCWVRFIKATKILWSHLKKKPPNRLFSCACVFIWFFTTLVQIQRRLP